MSAGARAEPLADSELLGLARSVLEAEGYEVELVEAELPMLLAENRYFILAVVATATIEGLIEVEGSASEDLVQRVSSGEAGPKLWDAYLVLMTQERSPDRSRVTRDLYEINYDTSRLRRLAHTGVPKTLSGVRNALTPFASPPVLERPMLNIDPFFALSKSLERRGVDENMANRAIEAFRQGGDLSDAI